MPEESAGEKAEMWRAMGLDPNQAEAYSIASTLWGDRHREAVARFHTFLDEIEKEIEGWAQHFPDLFHGDTFLNNLVCTTVCAFAGKILLCLKEGAILGNKQSVKALAEHAKLLTEALEDVTKHCFKYPISRRQENFSCRSKGSGDAK